MKRTKKLCAKICVKLPENDQVRLWTEELNTSVLFYRSNLAMAISILYVAVMIATGEANFVKAQKFIDAKSEGAIVDPHALAFFHPTMKVAYLVGSAGRLCLIVTSIKFPGLCKSYLIYNQAMLVIDFCLLQMDPQEQFKLAVLVSMVNFACYNFNAWVSFPALVVSQTCICLIRALVFKEER